MNMDDALCMVYITIFSNKNATIVFSVFDSIWIHRQ